MPTARRIPLPTAYHTAVFIPYLRVYLPRMLNVAHLPPAAFWSWVMIGCTPFLPDKPPYLSPPPTTCGLLYRNTLHTTVPVTTLYLLQFADQFRCYGWFCGPLCHLRLPACHSCCRGRFGTCTPYLRWIDRTLLYGPFSVTLRISMMVVDMRACNGSSLILSDPIYLSLISLWGRKVEELTQIVIISNHHPYLHLIYLLHILIPDDDGKIGGGRKQGGGDQIQLLLIQYWYCNSESIFDIIYIIFSILDIINIILISLSINLSLSSLYKSSIFLHLISGSSLVWSRIWSRSIYNNIYLWKRKTGDDDTGWGRAGRTVGQKFHSILFKWMKMMIDIVVLQWWYLIEYFYWHSSIYLYLFSIIVYVQYSWYSIIHW